jgi:hypothetical protein
MTPTEVARINRQTLRLIRRAKLIAGASIVLSALALALSLHAGLPGLK